MNPAHQEKFSGGKRPSSYRHLVGVPEGKGNAKGGTRTPTASSHGILNPARLPIPPLSRRFKDKPYCRYDEPDA